MSHSIIVGYFTVPILPAAGFACNPEDKITKHKKNGLSRFYKKLRVEE
jgi:hypothetical protein